VGNAAKQQRSGGSQVSSTPLQAIRSLNSEQPLGCVPQVIFALSRPSAVTAGAAHPLAYVSHPRFLTG